MIKVGDRVKVLDNDEMQGRSLADRFGHVEKLTSITGMNVQELFFSTSTGDPDATALVSFNDFSATVAVKNLKVV